MPDEQHGPSDPVTVQRLQELLAETQEVKRLLYEMLKILEQCRERGIAPGAMRSSDLRTDPPYRREPVSRVGKKVKRLTPREREVFDLLLTGMSNRAISRRLGIAERTVKNNLHALYRKLGVSGRAEAISRFLGVYSSDDQE